MSGQPSRSHLAVASAIVIAGLLISASLFIALEGEVRTTIVTITETSVSTTTITLAATVPSTTVTTIYCFQSGPVQSSFVQFVNDSSREPISGVTIGGSFQPNCQGDLPFPVQAATTSSNGTLPISIGANALGECGCTVGIYNLTIQYSGRLYNLTLNPSIEHLAQKVVYVIGLPSGILLGTQVTGLGVCASGTGSNATTFTC